jgi:integrase
MATVFKTTRMMKNRETGKLEAVIGSDGAPIAHPRWRTIIADHRGRRRMFTLSANRTQAQKQADMLEQREREIKNGILPPPEPEHRKYECLFDEVLDEYMAWGKIQGGRRGLPWDDEHAAKKERDLLFWRDALGLGDLGEAEGVLPKVEAECRKMFQAGNSGKTVSNRVQNLRALFLWCRRRGYVADNPLRELGRFNTDPTFTRRAMTLDEYRLLLSHCAAHRRLLYETAVCSGLRENELRMLEPKDLDVENGALHVGRLIDKARKARVQYIPASLMERLSAFAAGGGAKKLYTSIYRKQGARSGRKKPPDNPLLYVPANSATMLKRDLLAAGIPFETERGRLDFHALRTAYVNFLLDVGAAPKELQDLARHQTLEMTMNVYGRARDGRKRGLVEALGEMLAAEPEGGGETGSVGKLRILRKSAG